MDITDKALLYKIVCARDKRYDGRFYCGVDANAFPRTDLIVKRALQHHKNEKGDWSPWNAYIALALWKKYATALSQKSKKPHSIK